MFIWGFAEPRWKRQLCDFLVELSQLAKRGELRHSKELYKRYPLVRVGLRRALLFLKKHNLMNLGEELDLRVGIEEMRDYAPELVPSYEATIELLKFLEGFSDAIKLEFIVDESTFPAVKQAAIDDERAKAGLPPEDVCWQCSGTGVVEQPICGHCLARTPHSNCDDTWMKEVPCPVCQGKKDES